MRVNILAVGTRMPNWVQQGVNEYHKRMPKELVVNWREIPVARRNGSASPAQLCQREGKRLLESVPKGDRIIALDVQGKAWSTEQLAANLADWQMTGQNVSLLIGGPDGLSPECLAASAQRWSLGPLTLPHPLVRVVLAEQLYRAWSINANHPYHRA
ncbi:MAG: 23S rRNA (pseudouridine(1915)-N(3))-methyltransferase RlmH [Gammaproteobacteria bacterium]|nr:MAG: 23S rRNA (pseudouridine(1915)-N(3))-methyltransferase RlmH [Gammaproteobacteria bacterium]PIE37320.1 MAG: 23S rRNA (pseudouridine(1915)-N(3))-methyltransferase RlmH [Gammaproteobacteria bacterium]